MKVGFVGSTDNLLGLTTACVAVQVSATHTTPKILYYPLISSAITEQNEPQLPAGENGQVQVNNEVAPQAAPDIVGGDVNSDLKSPISLVYEIALKRNLNVIFEVLSEKVSTRRSLNVFSDMS